MTTWLVTGANRGIGLELCRQIAARGDDVIAACRTPSDGLSALGPRVDVVAGVEITADAAEAALLRATEGKRVDVLVHNAGVLAPDSLDFFEPAELRRQYEVNAIAPLRLTRALLPRLGAGSKVVVISSRAGSIGDNGSGGNYGYRMSKAALNMAAMSLTRDLAGRQVLVGVLHPGFIRTGMTGGSGNDDPPVAAEGLLARIDELDASRSGRFFHANGEELPW
jgi:NAD(P)-dependent dehydrogenase (short-subunit alcohol dehydrogenase family)